jgi:acyl-CoA thioesterase FadM
MAKVPLIFKSTHRIQFSDLDPYNHMSTGKYATYFVDHRMDGLRDYFDSVTFTRHKRQGMNSRVKLEVC